jgi:hypothetical protein
MTRRRDETMTTKPIVAETPRSRYYQRRRDDRYIAALAKERGITPAEMVECFDDMATAADIAIGGAWLVKTINGRFRVKWRDKDTVLQDRDFDTEAEARAFGGEHMEFRSDLETSLQQALELRRLNPAMSPEEAMERVGIVSVPHSGE